MARVPSRTPNFGNLSGTTASTFAGAANTGSGGGMDPMTGAAISAGLSAVMNLIFGGGNAASSSTQMPPEMRSIIRHQLGRMRMADPLYADVIGMARGMLPTRYRGAGPAMPLPEPGDPGTDLRVPTGRGEPTGRFAIPRDPLEHGPQYPGRER